MSGVLMGVELVSNLLGLLKVSEEGQRRKNLRQVKKTRKQMYRQFKKDGIDEMEKALLDRLDVAIVEAAIELGEF